MAAPRGARDETIKIARTRSEERENVGSLTKSNREGPSRLCCARCFRMLTTLSWVTEMRQQRGIRLSSSWPRVSYRMTKETHVCPGRQEWPVKIPPMLGNSYFRHENILFACCAQLLKPRLTYARLCDTIMNTNGRL